MNKVILMGRLTRDPDVRYTTGDNPMAVARFTLAVDRRFAKRDDPNAQTADFIGCVAFGKQAEFADKYLRQGTRVTLCGRIQTGSYTNKDGQKIYTTDVAVEEIEFAESKRSGEGSAAGQTAGQAGTANTAQARTGAADTGFMNIPDGIGDDEVPFA